MIGTVIAIAVWVALIALIRHESHEQAKEDEASIEAWRRAVEALR